MLSDSPYLALRRLLYAATMMLAVTATQSIAADSDADAAAAVQKFHDTLLHIMRNGDNLGFRGRYDILKPVIENRFDTPLIAKVILGRYWDGLNSEQKQQFISVFNDLSITTYASRFRNYEGERFEYLGTESLNKSRLLVRTRLVKSDGDNVRFDYLMHERDSKWYIMSVIAQGVNDLSLKRTEYSAIMETKGFDALISELRKKIAALTPVSGNTG